MINKLLHSLPPPNPITTPGVPTGMNLFTCKCHTIVTVPSLPPAASTHSGRAAWRSLGLLITLLLLELPELGLDGDGRLLGLRVAHVDVKVLWDVRLGRIWRGKGNDGCDSQQCTKTESHPLDSTVHS